MSCPYFWPAVPQSGGSVRNIMLPLGDLWSGQCCATASSPWTPDDPHRFKLCNLGYARDTCDRFPADSPDAVRFTIAGDDGSHIRIYYVIERDHHPFAHGPLEYSRAAQTLVAGPAAGTSLARQAEAYADSYLRHKEL